MKINDWIRLKEVENPDELKVGDLFLMGDKVIDQKETKIVGQEITYYKLLKNEGKSVEYIPIYDTLEEVV